MRRLASPPWSARRGRHRRRGPGHPVRATRGRARPGGYVDLPSGSPLSSYASPLGMEAAATISGAADGPVFGHYTSFIALRRRAQYDRALADVAAALGTYDYTKAVAAARRWPPTTSSPTPSISWPAWRTPLETDRIRGIVFPGEAHKEELSKRGGGSTLSRAGRRRGLRSGRRTRVCRWPGRREP